MLSVFDILSVSNRLNTFMVCRFPPIFVPTYAAAHNKFRARQQLSRTLSSKTKFVFIVNAQAHMINNQTYRPQDAK